MFNRLFSKSGLSLERLRTFCEVADAGSMAKAANGDGVKQSQFSRQIKELEEHFGRKLTEKSGRSVVLTGEGTELAALARRVLAALEDFQRDGASEGTELSLGAGESFHRGVILPRLPQIRERLSGVTLGLRNMRGADVVAGLLDGKLDLGVVDERDLSGNLKNVKLGRISYRLIVPQASVSATNQWRHALALPFVGMEGDGEIMRVVGDLAKSEGIEVDYIVKCSSWPAVSDALSAQQAVGILPSTMGPPSGFGEVAVPGLKGFERTLVLAWDGRRGNLRAVSALSQRVLGDVLRF